MTVLAHRTKTALSKVSRWAGEVGSSGRGGVSCLPRELAFTVVKTKTSVILGRSAWGGEASRSGTNKNELIILPGLAKVFFREVKPKQRQQRQQPRHQATLSIQVANPLCWSQGPSQAGAQPIGLYGGQVSLFHERPLPGFQAGRGYPKL